MTASATDTPPDVAVGEGARAELARMAQESFRRFRVEVPADLVPPPLPECAEARIRELVGHSVAQNTWAAYGSDWDRFLRWCAVGGFAALPAHPHLVAHYLATAASEVKTVRTGPKAGSTRWAYAPATLTRWLSSINQVHRANALMAPGQDEEVKRTIKGIRKTRASAQVRRAPLLMADIGNLVRAARAGSPGWPSPVAERRDCALLLFGFGGAFRRSELVSLRIGDVTAVASYGLHLLVRQSKNDQQAVGQKKALPFGGDHQTCAPCAYLRWRQVLDAWDAGGRAEVMRVLRQAPPFTGHVCRDHALPMPVDPQAWLFRTVTRTGFIGHKQLSGDAVNAIIRRRVAGAGYGAQYLAALGGHSLRAGFVTEAFRRGAAPAEVMQQTGHRSPAVLEIYRREYAPETGNAVARIGM